MPNIQANMQCSERFLEVIPEEKEATELTIEDLVSRVLLLHFETVFVDDVTVQFSPGDLPGQQVCSIHIHVECSDGETALQAHEIERLELVLEDHISCALIELLGSVDVGSVVVG